MFHPAYKPFRPVLIPEVGILLSARLTDHYILHDAVIPLDGELPVDCSGPPDRRREDSFEKNGKFHTCTFGPAEGSIMRQKRFAHRTVTLAHRKIKAREKSRYPLPVGKKSRVKEEPENTEES